MVGKKIIVVGVTASIAAYKALDVVRALKNQGHDVNVIMTAYATQLVKPKEFEKASGNPVQTTLFDPSVDYKAYLKKDKPMQHISLADSADLVLVCPATANVLAKVAQGFADDLLTSTILATSAPVVFAPAMNVKMWSNPFTQANVARLKHFNHTFIEPEYGDLACGYKGVGRLAGGEKILEIVNRFLQRTQSLDGEKVVVTAGATIEKLDAVRMLTNKASGKMGAALADEAFVRGAKTILIKGVHAVSGRFPYKVISVETADDMLSAIAHEVKNTDLFFHTAAVSDFAIKQPLEEKVKSDKVWNVKLEPKGKILYRLKKLNPHMKVIAFKAEHNVSEKQLIQRAYETLKNANADYIVANDIGKEATKMGSDTNDVYVIDRKKDSLHVTIATKPKIASALLDYVTAHQ